ncbi:MAG TPA: hypothetical protein VMR81_03525 [Patescibacteria group bacterium]|jgi:hypothetical protein|nr:hypothetical protein [Patescibacteria group bacterium]
MNIAELDQSKTPEADIAIQEKIHRFVDKLCKLQPDGTYGADMGIYFAVDIDEPIRQGVDKLIWFHRGPRNLLPFPYKHPDSVNVRPSVNTNISPQAASVDLFFNYPTSILFSGYSLNIKITPGDPYIESSVTFNNFQNMPDSDFDVRRQEPSQQQWELLYRMLINPYCGAVPDEAENTIILPRSQEL